MKPAGTLGQCPRRRVEDAPDGRLELVDGAGHAPWRDDPGGGPAQLRRFVAG